MAHELVTQPSVVFESVNIAKSKQPQLQDIPYSLSPSWCSCIFIINIGYVLFEVTELMEVVVMTEAKAAMELSSSVASTFFNNVAYVNNEAITPKSRGVLFASNFRIIFLDGAEGAPELAQNGSASNSENNDNNNNNNNDNNNNNNNNNINININNNDTNNNNIEENSSNGTANELPNGNHAPKLNNNNTIATPSTATVPILPKKTVNFIPLHAIGNITFVIPHKKDESSAVTLQLWCKDWRLITFTFETSTICNEVYKKLSERAFSIENVFAFCCYYPEQPPSEHVMEQEYTRLKLSDDKWRITTMNQDYSKIPTYPAKFIVPKNIVDSELEKIFNFRCNQRIPAVSWVSPTGAVIARSSQPLAGIWLARCEADEALVKSMFSKNERYPNATMYIMDCRSKLSAFGNMAKGLGYEKPEGYSERCEITWMGIDNIHAMRDSFRNMYKLCLGSQSDVKWLSNLEYTRWIDHLNLVISTAVKAVDMIQKGSSVLVHCSDGWDRTPQITSLAQLLLDPYYRSLDGFLTLISKEWISFGHKFQLRAGHGCNNFWNNEYCSPIFLQWIDCVWQVMLQFPQCFEFNETFLVDLLDNLYNCHFAEFLFNSEKEMVQSVGRLSLWHKYRKYPENFINPFYSAKSEVLFPDPSPKRLRFWTGYYLRYYQPLEDGMGYIHQQGKHMKKECARLAQELEDLNKKLEDEAQKRQLLERQLREIQEKPTTEERPIFTPPPSPPPPTSPKLDNITIIDEYEPNNETPQLPIFPPNEVSVIHSFLELS